MPPLAFRLFKDCEAFPETAAASAGATASAFVFCARDEEDDEGDVSWTFFRESLFGIGQLTSWTPCAATRHSGSAVFTFRFQHTVSPGRTTSSCGSAADVRTNTSRTSFGARTSTNTYAPLVSFDEQNR